jgi:hypothetical protein
MIQNEERIAECGMSDDLSPARDVVQIEFSLFENYSITACITAFSKSRSTWRLGLVV